MNHYPHHIGDFDKATRHLTRIERSIYRDLIELYYDTEAELTLDLPALCRKIIARTNEESTAVEQVLNEFFIKTATGWFHSRCDQEIENYRLNNSQKAAAGRASAAKKAAKRQQAMNGNPTDVEQPLNERSTDVEQTNNGTPTNQNQNQNQEPIKDSAPSAKSPEPAKRAARLPKDWQLPDEWAIWAKQERPDLNPEAIADRFRDYWIGVPGSKGCKLDWAATWRNFVRNERKPAKASSASYEAPWERASRERMQALAPGAARRAPGDLIPVGNFIDEVRDVISIESR